MINAIQSTNIQQQTTTNTLSNNTPNGSSPDQFLDILQASFRTTAIPDSNSECFQKNNRPLNLDSNTSYLVVSEDVNTNIKQSYQEFTALVDDALEEAGIDKYPSFEVFANDKGKLYLNSDRDDKYYIEHILNSSKKIKQTFQEMSDNTAQAAAMERILDACYQHSDYQQSGRQQNYSEDTESSEGTLSIQIGVKGYISGLNSYGKESPADTLSIQIGVNGYIPRLYSYGKESELQAFEEIKAGNFDDARFKKPLELETTTLLR